MTDERSGSGGPIYRHEHARDPEWSGGDARLVEAVDAHVARHIGKPARVWHQQLSPYVHALVDLFDEADASELLIADRPSVIPTKRRRFGLF